MPGSLSLRATFRCSILLFFTWLSPSIPAQEFPPTPDEHKDVPRDKVRLPNGKLQQDEILKEEHNRELQDARQLVELSQALQKDLEQDGVHVLSISSLHRTEDIEKLAKRIRSRIRGY